MIECVQDTFNMRPSALRSSYCASSADGQYIHWNLDKLLSTILHLDPEFTKDSVSCDYNHMTERYDFHACEKKLLGRKHEQ